MASVGRYETYEQLGLGSTGTVYRARDIVLGREVALRILNQNARLSSRLIESFTATGQVSAGWLHPNIASIYNLGETSVGAFLATELLTGAEMRSYIRGRCALTLLQKLDLLSQACNGLAHAHEHKIIHAAIKPGTFFIDDRQQVKILDLGIRYINLPDDQTDPKPGLLDYFSPEQLSGGTCDARSDIFSAAVVFYEFLVNVHPFRDTNIARRIREDLPDPLLRHDPTLPRSLEALLAKALANKPVDRVQTASQFAASFRAIESELMSGIAPKPSFVADDRLAPRAVPGQLAIAPTTEIYRPKRVGSNSLSKFQITVLATLGIAVCVILAAYLVTQNKQNRKMRSIAEAQVHANETALLEAADPQSRIVEQLHRGVRLEVLDHAPNASESFVHVQYPAPNRTMRSGYVAVADLWDWKSANPEVAWSLLLMQQPAPNAGPNENAEYLTALASFIERFPDSPRIEEAKRIQQRFEPINTAPPQLVAEAPAQVAQTLTQPDPASPEQAEKSRSLLEPVPALWEDGDLERILEVTRQAIALDPQNAQAKQWRSKAQKALRKLNDQ